MRPPSRTRVRLAWSSLGVLLLAFAAIIASIWIGDERVEATGAVLLGLGALLAVAAGIAWAAED